MDIIYIWSKLFKKLHGKAIINSVIDKSSKIEAGSHIVNSVFGKYSFCGYDCEILNCEVGSFCSIANNVIIGGAMHPIDWVSMSPVFYEGRDSIEKKFSTHKRDIAKTTYIEHDVWIGRNAIIKQGVKIGVGSIIGMGSVVTKDVEPYTIVAGCPAKLIRKRFDSEICSKLLKSKWWEYSDEQLAKYSNLFTTPINFIKEIEK